MKTRRVRAPVPVPVGTGGSCPIGPLVKTGDFYRSGPPRDPEYGESRHRAGPGARRRPDREAPADRLDPLAARRDADAPRRERGSRVRARSPTPSSETYSTISPRSRRTVTSTRVAAAWRAALASSSRASESSSSSRAPAASGRPPRAPRSAWAALLLGDGQQRRLQPAVVQHRRVQGAHHLAQAGEDGGEALLRGGERVLVAAAARQREQLVADGEQLLQRAVVQRLGDLRRARSSASIAWATSRPRAADISAISASASAALDGVGEHVGHRLQERGVLLAEVVRALGHRASTPNGRVVASITTARAAAPASALDRRDLRGLGPASMSPITTGSRVSARGR